jgi:thiol-disulfide isomerase/thioredoxin
MRRSPGVTRLLAALAVLVLLLTGCADDISPPGPSDIEVDTPALREMKAEAGIEPCVPGPGGGDLPDLTLPCLGGGEEVDLSSLTGPLVVNLWNTPCDACLDEMPALQQFHETHGDTVPVLGIDVTDTPPDFAISFAEMVGATYPQLADPGGDIFDTDLGLRPAFPQTILVDADGEVATMHAGGLLSVAEIEELVTTHLGPVL